MEKDRVLFFGVVLMLILVMGDGRRRVIFRAERRNASTDVWSGYCQTLGQLGLELHCNVNPNLYIAR